MTRRRVRVLVVDDSALARAALTRALRSDPSLAIVGEATDGQQAIELTASLEPDIVVMDIVMPGVDGLEATRKIMSSHPLPILLVTGEAGRIEGPRAFEGMGLGALDVMLKPRFGTDDGPCEEAIRFADKVRRLASVRALIQLPMPPRAAPGLTNPPPLPTARAADSKLIIGIVASTGGPPALSTVLAGLPPTLPAAVVIVQHLASGFDQHLVDALRASCLPVGVACHGDRLQPGHVIVAPADRHLRIAGSRRIMLDDGPAVRHLKPCGDLMLESLASGHARHAVGVVMTGMGRDGAAGLMALRAAGGHTIAQDEATSVIFGMPAAAIARGAAMHICPLSEIAGHLTRFADSYTGRAGRRPSGGHL